MLKSNKIKFTGLALVVALIGIWQFVGFGNVVRLVNPNLGLGHERIGPLPGDVVTYDPKYFTHPNRVPTGEPGDPFHISEIKGDGWVMLDSGPGFVNVGWNKFSWIDENRVVFAAKNTAHGSSLSKAMPGSVISGIFVWDLNENRIYRRKGLPPFSSFCIANGYVSFGINRERDENGKILSWAQLYGKWGEEKEIVYDEQNGKLLLNEMTCDFDRIPKEYVDKFAVKFLLPGHGELILNDFERMRELKKKAGRLGRVSNKHMPNWRLINREKKSIRTCSLILGLPRHQV